MFGLKVFLFPLFVFWFQTTKHQEQTVYYRIFDGNNNVFEVRGDTLEYIPMKPEMSSSGWYDGGEPALVFLQPNDLHACIVLIEQTLNQPVHLLKKRDKGTVLIKRVHSPMKTVILPGEGSQWRDLEKMLIQFLSKYN